jgi:hypothetical protein
MMNELKNTIIVVLSLFIGAAVIAQVPMNKTTKKYEFHNETPLSVGSAGSNELINRFYYWGLAEFADYKYEVTRDDSTFRSVTFKVVMPMVENHYGVKFTHKDRALTYTLKFDAEKKDYSYWINDFEYKATEVDRKNREEKLDTKLEDFKGAAKTALLEELDLMFTTMIDSLAWAGEVALTEEQSSAVDTWIDERKTANANASKDAAKAKKEADAAAKQAAKDEAAAEKAAAKEAAAQAKADAAKEKEEAAAAKEAEAEAAKKALEESKQKAPEGEK